MPCTTTKIIAHRGASYDAPENTLAAIGLAWAQNADGAECDIHVTADNEVVLLHDESLGRTGGINLTVPKSSLADIRAVDVGSWKGSAWRGEKVPLLGETLAAIPSGKKLVVEIKGGTKVIPPMIQAIEKAEASGTIKRGQLEFISFDENALRAAKTALPECKALYLSGDYKKRSLNALDELVAFCVQSGFDGLDLDRGWPIDSAFVQRVREAGLLLYVWTVNDPDRAKELARASVDAITTDRPALIRDALDHMART